MTGRLNVLLAFSYGILVSFGEQGRELSFFFNSYPNLY